MAERDGVVRHSQPAVVAVSRDAEHRSSKAVMEEIVLLPGLGVPGDAHAGATVQHRSRVAADPTQPNLRRASVIELVVEPLRRGREGVRRRLS